MIFRFLPVANRPSVHTTLTMPAISMRATILLAVATFLMFCETRLTIVSRETATSLCRLSVLSYEKKDDTIVRPVNAKIARSIACGLQPVSRDTTELNKQVRRPKAHDACVAAIVGWAANAIKRRHP